MRIESRLFINGEVTSIFFDKQSAAMLKDVVLPNLKKYSDKYITAQLASNILIDSIESSEARQESLVVDLEDYEIPSFVGEVAIALTMHMDEQLEFWETLTSRTPRWKVESDFDVPAGYHELDELYDPYEGIDLNIIERELGYVNKFGNEFKKLGEQING